MATPVLERENSHTRKQHSSMKRIRPVGTVKPPMLKESRSSRICLKLVLSRPMVLRRPVPSGQRSLSDVKGSTSQAIHITDTMEKPTYVVTDISSPLRRLSSRPYTSPPPPRSQRRPQWQTGSRPSRGCQTRWSSAADQPATRPMGRPRLRLMPHWMPGTMASTMMAFMPMRTTLLESSVDSERS